MDVWVVAAATSAGFIAKYLQRLLRNSTNSISGLSTHDGSDLEGHESTLLSETRHHRRCPLRIFAGMNKFGSTDVSANEEWRLLDQDLSELSQSVSVGDDCNVHHLTNFREGEDGNDESCDIADFVSEFPRWEMGYARFSSGKKTSLRNKRPWVRLLEPVSSMESCLMAQLCREHAEMDEYVFTMRQSSSESSMSSLLLTDGCLKINGECDERNSRGRETAIGVPPLRTLGLSRHTAKLKHSRKSGGRDTNAVNRKHMHLKGSVDGSFLFCIGLAIGVMTASTSSKKEVNLLKELLVNTEDLVQDLQDELDMKNSLTMKELDEENLELKKTRRNSGNQTSGALSPCTTFDKLKNSDNVNSRGVCESLHKTESISNIAAELEAELERLEVSMNSSSLKAKLSGVVELDPESDTDFCRGEPLAAKFGEQGGGDIQDSNQSYPVSPHELTMRLHELIQSRLEQRIKELEAALETSQRKVCSLESEREKSCFTCTTPIGSKPVGLAQNGVCRYSLHSQCMMNEQRTTPNPRRNECNVSRVEELKVAASATMSEDGNSDCDDEFDKLLIKQIVENNKFKSPVILNAHKLLFQMDEDQF